MTILHLVGGQNFRIFKINKKCCNHYAPSWVLKNLEYYDTIKRDYVHLEHYKTKEEARENNKQ